MTNNRENGYYLFINILGGVGEEPNNLFITRNETGFANFFGYSVGLQALQDPQNFGGLLHKNVRSKKY